MKKPRIENQILSINKVHFPVTSLGFGRRVGIWTQGCSIHCAGCVNQDTWEPRPDCHIDITTLLKGIRPWLRQADGVTISGGEPFDQPEGLLSLVCTIRAGFAGDILVYSGFSLPSLVTKFPKIIQAIDVLISEPYDVKRPQTLTLRGSDNQIITLLSPLARERYPRNINEMKWTSPRGFDVMSSDKAVWLVGIPKQKTLAQLQGHLKLRGFTSKSSQQASGQPPMRVIS